VPDAVARQRYDRFMLHQQAISLAKQRLKIGTEVTAIIDEVTPKGGVGRTRHDAPEIDGSIMLSSRRPLRAGDIVTAKVKRADAYDLHGSVV
jgi:ribosomal protein S12 methylthiotransferase